MIRALRLALPLLLLATTAWSQDRMIIDEVDLQKYLKNKEGRIRFYVDILDKDNHVLEKQDESKLKFFVNDEEFKTEKEGGKLKSIKLQTFKDVEEPMAVGVLVTNYGGFVPANTGEQNMFAHGCAGLQDLLKEFKGSFDYFGIWLYNESGLQEKKPFGSDRDRAIDALDSLSKELPPSMLDPEGAKKDSGGQTQRPKFYQYLLEAVKKMAERTDLPARRVLIVVSDGAGEYDIKEDKKIDKKLKQVIEAARDARIKIFSFGAALQGDEYLTKLEQVSAESFGLSERAEEADELERKISEFGKQLKKQYVIDVVAPGILPAGNCNFKLTGETENSEKVSNQFPKALKCPEWPTDWMYYLKWTGIILGSVLGLFLFIWLMVKLFKWMARRKAERVSAAPVEVEQVVIYEGPDRGKLRVKSGPMAGEVFPLTKDITTLGRLDSNDIQIEDESVSKRHAGIKIEDMKYEIADFGSTSGTFVNGRKINKLFLKNGDVVKLGNTEMEFTLK